MFVYHHLRNNVPGNFHGVTSLCYIGDSCKSLLVWVNNTDICTKKKKQFYGQTAKRTLLKKPTTRQLKREKTREKAKRRGKILPVK